MKPETFGSSEVNVNIVGGNLFGRYPKMSSESTFNMIKADDALVPYPGYKKVIETGMSGVGRKSFTSYRAGIMIHVIGSSVFRVSGPPQNLIKQKIFDLDTYNGDVFIDENVSGQIAICDKKDIWIYNWQLSSVTKAVLPNDNVTGQPIDPGYITYHDGYFITPDTRTSKWYLSTQNDGTQWNWAALGAPNFSTIQTKPTNAVCALRAPGKGNLILLIGENVTEFWFDNGSSPFPYQRTNSASVDYGCLSSGTIAAMDEYIAWLGSNEYSSPVIMVSNGSSAERISTDGIDFKLSNVVVPEDSFAFFYKESGHVFYQITFYNKDDNFTLVYDFNEKMFIYATDENMDYHIAKSVCYYNNTHYFTSNKDSSIYEINNKYTYYDYRSPGISSSNEYTYVDGSTQKAIPRVRVTDNIRLSDSSRVYLNNATFTIEQGEDPFFQMKKWMYLCTTDGFVITQCAGEGYVGDGLTNANVLQNAEPSISMAISRDSGYSFSGFTSKQMNALGDRINRVVFWRLGAGNDIVIQLRFWSYSRIVVFNGIATIVGSGSGQ